jgi:hypothetical protein
MPEPSLWMSLGGTMLEEMLLLYELTKSCLGEG